MPGRLLFSTTADGGHAPSTRMTIDSSGDVTLSNGNIVFGTSGTGLDFSAAGNASGMTSELLDDYEEGTFTAQLGGATNHGAYEINGGATYTKKVDKYICKYLLQAVI